MFTLILYTWLIPALPGLINLGTSWWLQGVFTRQGQSAWRVAHYTRLAGIFVFMLSGWCLQAGHVFDIRNLLIAQWHPETKDVYCIIVFALLISIVQSRSLQKRAPRGMETYTQAHMGNRELFFHCLTWAVYLFLYEMYFRGYLLSGALPQFSTTWVIIYNVVLYALVHAYKNVQQVVSAIPFGFIMCAGTWWTGHIWFAFCIHLLLALGFEIPLLSNRTLIIKSRSNESIYHRRHGLPGQ
jgi:membrane protease YdiL (CAAX protease family)